MKTADLIHRLQNPTYIVPNAHLDTPSTIQTMNEAAEVIKRLIERAEEFSALVP
jgi:hypothetical protein